MLSRRHLLATSALIGLGSQPAGSVARDEVLVFAAASLADVLRQVAERWSAADATAPVLRFSFASSSTLARQIEQGAPAQLFISADEAWMDHLDKLQHTVAGSRRVIAGNRLVVVRGGMPAGESPREDFATLRSALGLDLADARIATGDPAHVPVGRYAQAALESLGLWALARERLVRAENVRSALAFVERGEARSGIVYATDAALSRRVGVAARFPQGSHPPVRYPAALLSGAGPAAARVLAQLLSPTAQATLREAGFSPA